MKEIIKNKFSWDDRKNKDTFIPCDYCEALNIFPTCNDNATSSACNHCDYNIISYCLTHNTEEIDE